MKYWNKQPGVRATWTEVKTTDFFGSGEERKRWCQNQDSDGKFYFYYQNSWWFERPEDATLFTLKWL